VWQKANEIKGFLKKVFINAGIKTGGENSRKSPHFCHQKNQGRD
jgi:hypothetical protein